MVNYFNRLYSLIVDKNAFLAFFKFYSIQRYLLRLSANTILPIYFLLTNRNDNFKLKQQTNTNIRLIVTLTSFPTRVESLWMVIETLLRQTTKPDKIILWISNNQFNSIESLPNKLLLQRKRGLEIRMVDDDLRSHKKYLYALSEFPDSNILTVDDDVFYSSSIISKLIDLNRRYPTSICCNHAHRIMIKNGDIIPYDNWENLKKEQSPCVNIMPIGVGGVLYPPYSLYKDVFNVEVFKLHCFLADDIWLNAMAHLKGTSVARSNFNSGFLPVYNKNNIALYTKNINEGLNNKQLKDIRDYYIQYKGIDPYHDLFTKII